MPRATVQDLEGTLRRVEDTLQPYGNAHPRAELAVRRLNRYSVQVRVIDPDFEGVNRSQRFQAVWGELEGLAEGDLNQVSALLLLTPAEAATSPANLDFERPVPSRL